MAYAMVFLTLAILAARTSREAKCGRSMGGMREAMSQIIFIATMAIVPGQTQSSADLLQAQDIRKIHVGGELGRRIDRTASNNLMVLDLDQDFLKPFRERKSKDGYVGLGKTIDAFVHFAAYTGDKSILERKRYLVREAIATQEPDGYIGLCAPDYRMWPLWDVHEMSYLAYGLTSDYRLFGEEASLAAAQKLIDYIITRWSAAPERTPGDGEIMDYMAFTGLEPTSLALFDACGDRRYLDFGARFRHLDTWDGPLVLGRWGKIQGHAYAYLYRSMAQLHLNRIEANPALLNTTNRAENFLLKDDGLAITGTCGQHECWHDTQEGEANLGETCATAYLLRWWNELFRMKASPIYGDLMERAIYNALFAAQSPDGRKIRYYSPFEGPRVYFDKDSYCCPCNYRRILPELPGLAYYTGKDVIYVNLYTASTADMTLPNGSGVAVRQSTEYPRAGQVRLELTPEKPADFALALRIPKWCTGAAITVNGAPQDGPIAAGTFHTIRRTWHAGDAVELTMPMALRLVKGRKAQAGRAAVMYGPRVFCLDRAKNPALAEENLRLITLDPASLSGPFPDDTVEPGGLACTVRAWRTTAWYPMAKTDWELTLTEFPDPNGEATYFHVPNPNDPLLTDEPLRLE